MDSRSLDQRILGDEGFMEELMRRTERRDIRGRRHRYKLTEIARATGELCGITLAQLRENGKGRVWGRGEDS